MAARRSRSCKALGKLLYRSVPRFPHLDDGVTLRVVTRIRSPLWVSPEPGLLQRPPEHLLCYRRHGHGDGGITPAWDRPSAARGPSCPVWPRGVTHAGGPGVALGPGHLSPPSSPVSCRLAAGGSGGGWGWYVV